MQYRIAIGAFYCKRYCRLLRKYTFLIKYGIDTPISGLIKQYVIDCYVCFLIFSCKAFLDNNDFQLLLLLLLIICMDIETNPGPTSELSIFNWNIRSLRNKLHILEDVANEYHILCLTETHLDDSIQTSDVLLDNYSTPIRKDRNFAGGGVLIYVSDLLFCKRRPDIESNYFEAIWVEVKIQNQTIMLCAVYRPPNSDQSFWDYLDFAIDKAYETSNNIVVTGDINVDLLTERARHPIFDILKKYNLENTINEPTRIGQHRRSLLDPIFVSQTLTFTNSSVIDIDREHSDHNACVCDLAITNSLSGSYKREIWIYKKGDYVKFNELISAYDWDSSLLNCENIDSACQTFTYKYLNMAKECIPRRTITIRRTDKPWMTSELRTEIRKRDRLHTIYKNKKTESSLNKFKQQRNKVNNMKKYARQSFYENINTVIDTLYTGDPKAYWKLINRISKQSGSSSVVPPLFNSENNILASNDQEKAILLNEYFCSISNVNDDGIHPPNFENRTDSRFNVPQLTEMEISDILKNLKLGKASGSDMISHNMLKHTADTINRPLKTLFNMSLSTQCFPSLWKEATVIPLFKKGDRHQVSNYRPVSLISCLGKVFERVVFKHMYNYLLNENLFYNLQSGFLPNHTTVYQLIEMYDSICNALENKQHICLIFCDISKAFDRVWHKGLIKKLGCYGFHGEFLEWLISYLSNRKQQVLINNNKSSLLRINAGVPQGSVLGPLLFLLYINDIADDLESLARLFADDTSLAHASSNKNDIETIINRDLKRINDWSKNWLTTFNPSKTEMLFISNTLSANDISINFDGTILNPVDSHRHLGVIFSSNAKWQTHIDSIYDSCMKKINVMRKFKYMLSKQVLIRIYKCFILPVLEYACEVWDGCTERDKQRIENIQLEAARIACGLPVFCSKEAIYFESELEPLAKRREQRKLTLFYKMHNQLVPTYLQNLLPPTVAEVSHYPLRNSSNYTLPQHRLSLSGSSFISSTTRLWNSLDDNIRNSQSLACFKRSLLNPDRQRLPFHIYNGERKHSILHARLRQNCSTLNYDLFRCNLTDDPSCLCGNPCENVFHYFFECPLYLIQRHALFNDIQTVADIDLNTLLCGSTKTSTGNNVIIFKAVHRFIRDSDRF